MLGGMDQRLTALERAFQLAKSNTVATVDEIRTVLKREGFDGRQLEGASLSRQLRRLIDVALAARQP
jgi:hypothetical protein